MRVILFFFLVLIGAQAAKSQDLNYVRSLIDTLCAPRYDGRGYVNNGDLKAGTFIVTEADKIGLKPVSEAFYQNYRLNVNAFPGRMDVVFNDDTLITGRDYIIDPNSKGVFGDFDVLYFKPKWAESKEKIFKLSQDPKVKNTVVIFDLNQDNAAYNSLIANLHKNPLKASAYVVLTDQKLTWSVGRRELDVAIFQVLKTAIPKKVKKVHLAVDQAFVLGRNAVNVIAEIPGKSDSTIVFSAHYDHLGRMGEKTYIAGASDNASGTAMLFDLAKYYLKNPSDYTIQFMWFSGEEAGLLGSMHYVEHPLKPLEEIKFLINLDLMADAKEGITVVNGKIFPDHFARLSSLNSEAGLIPRVKARGEAANSDHYPFSEKDVPAFFIYTEGDYEHYHDIDDVPANIPMTNYDKVFQLIVDFVEYGL